MKRWSFFTMCLFWIRNRICPVGQLPREDLRRAPLPPRPLVTPGPRCSLCSLSPHTYCHASCIRSVPSPVILSYTDILPSIWSAPSLSSCPTHVHTIVTAKANFRLTVLSSKSFQVHLPVNSLCSYTPQ